jgi:hypothetical protein
MGMGLEMIVSPNTLADPPHSVAYCGATSLNEASFEVASSRMPSGAFARKPHGVGATLAALMFVGLVALQLA